MTIAFDAVAAWEMRRKGWEPEEWLQRLQRKSDGLLEDGHGWVSWQQKPDLPPSGQWFSRLVLVVHEDGQGHIRFDAVGIGVARYMQDQTEGPGPKSGAIMIPGPLPEMLLAGLPGRRLGAVVEFEPLRDTLIREAHNVDVAARFFTVIAVDPVRESIETPYFLLP